MFSATDTISIRLPEYFDLGGLIGAIAMVGMAIFAGIRHTAQLYHEERLT